MLHIVVGEKVIGARGLRELTLQVLILDEILSFTLVARLQLAIDVHVLDQGVTQPLHRWVLVLGMDLVFEALVVAIEL